jgi:hypothetical protein
MNVNKRSQGMRKRMNMEVKRGKISTMKSSNFTTRLPITGTLKSIKTI